ncbi:MAG: outer membrane lipoprotein carrier protein LolA [Saprospiraceae bacterium]|nr:outer membrane lipoprotein carrier protein LolA [Saprospiraceae bacterium]
MRISFILLSFLISASFFAQEVSDPEATRILSAMKEKFDGYKNIQANFSLSIEFPEEDPEIQKGILTMARDKYKLDMESQSIYCDGTDIWLHLKNRNEVQINTYEDTGDSDIMSPKDLFRIYEQEDYIYALSNEFVENGIPVQQIEFKPTDPNSEYSKMRLTLDKKGLNMIRLKAFAKDGSRFTLSVDKFDTNLDMPSSFCEFDASQFPNIIVEDLRL